MTVQLVFRLGMGVSCAIALLCICNAYPESQSMPAGPLNNTQSNSENETPWRPGRKSWQFRKEQDEAGKTIVHLIKLPKTSSARSTLKESQRMLLRDWLLGRTASDLIKTDLRLRILEQTNALPNACLKLLKGRVLPTSIQEKMVLLPDGLNDRLGIPAGYRLCAIGCDVVMYDASTNRIMDVWNNLLL